MVGYQDIIHIPDREPGKKMDFSIVIETTTQCSKPQVLEIIEITIGLEQNILILIYKKIYKSIWFTHL